MNDPGPTFRVEITWQATRRPVLNKSWNMRPVPVVPVALVCDDVGHGAVQVIDQLQDAFQEPKGVICISHQGLMYPHGALLALAAAAAAAWLYFMFTIARARGV